MIKIMFFDYRKLESIQGFIRELEPPAKHTESPFLAPDLPWEYGNLLLTGSVLRTPGGPFQMWYNIKDKAQRWSVGYAESDDGLSWRKPFFKIIQHEGRATNVVLAANPIGPAVIYDEREARADLRYKMLVGAEPSNCICAYGSPDGIHWSQIGRFPVICTEPDCPIGLLRAGDGRYVAYHRFMPFSGRRVCRSESWNFTEWTSDPRLVLEPDAGDPPQTQCYGLGSVPYGPYEIGTLWVYHNDVDDSSKMKGYYEPELAYARSGYAWHRAAQGQPFISRGPDGEWDGGLILCASQPVFLDDEIRYYYSGTSVRHAWDWELLPQRAGLGMAYLKPDRFVALAAGESPAELVTVPWAFGSPDLLINAVVAPAGELRAALLDVNWKELPGFTEAESEPIVGDSTAHAVRWRAVSLSTLVQNRTRVRVRLRGRRCRVYSIFNPDEGKALLYLRFSAPPVAGL